MEMRARLILAVLAGVLFCSLATIELTELIRLADDTSNDFSLLQTQQGKCSTVIPPSQQRQLVTIPCGLDPQRNERPRLAPSICLKQFSSIVCVLRT